MTTEKSALAIGSGTIEVYATPAMIALVERACRICVSECLCENETTVGTKVDIRHISATPVSMMACAECELVEIDRKRLVFKVDVFDECGKIAEGTHERFIVDIEGFTEKAEHKLKL